MNPLNYTEFRANQQEFESQQGVLKYHDIGQGEVLLLLHGIPTSGWLYRKLLLALEQHGFRLIVPDMLGFGSSDSPKGYSIYSEQEHAKRLLSLMDYLQISSWNHLIHDAGGLWTWELFKLSPTRIKRLVILNTIILESGFSPPIRFNRGIIAKMAMWAYGNGITTNLMLNGLFKSGLLKNNLTKEDLIGYKSPLLKGKTKAMYYFFTQTCHNLPDYSQVLASIKIPVKIFWGTHDSFLKLEPQKEALKQLLNLKEDSFIHLDAKHFIQEEVPEQLTGLIADFIREA